MENLSFHSLFSGLNGVHRKKYKKGTTLFRQGDFADSVYYVESGELQLIRYTPDGHSVCLHTAGDGESFAEAALFTDIYHCNGEVTRNSVVWSYPRLEVLRRINEDAQCMQRFYAILAAQVRHMRFLTELRSIHSATERVMQYFRMKAGPDGRLVLNKTLINTAAELGLAHETFYRTLKKLENAGRLSRQDTKTFILT